ncbi:hypothetical protein B0H65DRAFT_443120 [Neurospora tetraspora]|uniref:Uncharacterized protein n=1 Tax=Neurospora tetraspora TaxID=94610 RepID=A0AAE0JCF5_9PEZI|nr:hypothetical protein B0H65DRAFT_443120 [Neurospora tetraspora]
MLPPPHPDHSEPRDPSPVPDGPDLMTKGEEQADEGCHAPLDEQALVDTQLLTECHENYIRSCREMAVHAAQIASLQKEVKELKTANKKQEDMITALYQHFLPGVSTQTDAHEVEGSVQPEVGSGQRIAKAAREVLKGEFSTTLYDCSPVHQATISSANSSRIASDQVDNHNSVAAPVADPVAAPGTDSAASVAAAADDKEDSPEEGEIREEEDDSLEEGEIREDEDDDSPEKGERIWMVLNLLCVNGQRLQFLFGSPHRHLRPNLSKEALAELAKQEKKRKAREKRAAKKK